MKLILPPTLAGAFDRDALYALGIGDTVLRALRHDDVLRSFRRGTFVLAAEYHAADPPGRHALEVQSLAVAMRSRTLVAAGLSAAQIHGLALLDRPPKLLYVVTTDPGAVGISRDGYVLRTAELRPEDVCTRHGVQVTTVARTVTDLLCELDFCGGATVTDSALHQRLVTKPELWSLLDAAGSRPGIETARKALEFADARAESPLESASRAKLYLERIPVPELQVWLRDDIRVDKFWPIGIGVAGDPDGREKYVADGPARTREVVQRDLARAAWISERHVHVRWGWAELDDPAALAARIRAAFAEAERRAS